MNWNQFFYKWHKWAAVIAGLLTFIWFFSGIVMILPSPLLGRGSATSPRTPAAPDYRDAGVRVPEAIRTIEAGVGKSIQVTAVQLRPLHGRLFYVITAGDGRPHLVDAVSGERLVITEPVARDLVRAAFGESSPAGKATLVEEHGWEYDWGLLPAYRFELGDGGSTIVFVSADTGEIRVYDRLGRIRGLIGGLHTLEFLRPLLPGWTVKLTMLVFSLAGLAMTMLGGGILMLQLGNWLRVNRRAA